MRLLSQDDARRVLRLHQRDIAHFVHAQMQAHYWEEMVEYEVRVSAGFSELRPCAYTPAAGEEVLSFRQSPAHKSNMARYLFGGCARCLYPVQKFESDPERILAVILDRDAEKWFRPTRGQFQIYYRSGAGQLEYQPDFVAETAEGVFRLEVKARRHLEDADVLAKQAAAVEWCRHASAHTCDRWGQVVGVRADPA